MLLEFERGALDCVELRAEVANRLLAGDKLKPEYASRGIVRHAFIEPFLFFVDFNMDDPVVGGMSNDRIALRRAIALGLDTQNLVDVVYAGQAQPANQLIPPGVTGHDPSASTRPLYDPAAAKALLDRFGYDRRDAEGYRKTPDGKRLTVTLLQRTAAISREMQTLWKKDMDAIGIRIDFQLTPFQDFIKEVIGGKYQLATTGFGGLPTGNGILQLLDSRQPPFANQSRFKIGRVRSLGRSIPAQPRRARADRGGPQLDRDRAHLRAAAAADIPARERFRPAVAARVPAAGIQRVLAVHGHRPRAAEAGELARDQGATRAGRCRNPRKRARPPRTGSPAGA